ncbi:MAG: hypothetical protein Kow00124_17550 [Anaerolineae bacterium]
MRYYSIDMEDSYANWGSLTLMYEVDEEGEVLRQIEVYKSGRVLFYDQEHEEDEYGSLSEPLHEHERYMRQFEISSKDFERAWRSLRPLNR